MNYTVNYTTKDWKKETLKDLLVKIDYSEYDPSERSDFSHEWIKIEIKEHRRYSFQKDFNIDFEYLNMDFSDYTKEELDDSWEYAEHIEQENKMNDILKNYYVFWLDFFEHSSIAFTLACNRIDLWYYNMDRSNNCWFIAVKKDLAKDETEARKLAEEEIENYTNYCNGWIMEYSIEEADLYYSKDEKKDPITYYDTIDSCCWFLNWDFCKEYVLDSLKAILKEKNIDFKEIEIEEK